MKGLSVSVEEKAARYDAAIERAKNTIEVNQTIPDIVECVESLFPELAESKDERIRKWLIYYFKEVCDNVSEKEKKGVLAWLERQCSQILANSAKTCKDKQKPTEEYNITGIKSKHAQGKLGEMIKNLKPINEVLEQKPADKVERKGMNITEEDMTPFQKKVFCIIDTTIEEEQGLKQVCDELLRLAHDEIMQNTTWSEEDEEKMRSIFLGIESYSPSIIYGNGKEEVLNWFKSLKDRVQPHSQWKPSGEQIDALEKECIAHSNYELCRLLEQLKKLREE